MPENLGKITAKNAKRSHAVDAGRSKRPLRKLNSKFDSVRPCANESGLVCKTHKRLRPHENNRQRIVS